ncbi:MAG: methylated-DNA--[protein]-cysteine S-methyltransferase [Gammaproteobacteria bacterium]|nr:methylated-DNA--[protein]-cysteine S-methyltransferase [Gammaproteobacteria bacterium]
MRDVYYAELESSLGTLSFACDDDGRLLELNFGSSAAGAPMDDRRCEHVKDQLAAYLEDKRTTFDLALAPAGTPFQRRVWKGLTDIPYGQVISYGELARRIGMPGAARAVGQANGANPIPIVIPCHRVIAANGTIGGFSSGLAIKRQLLAHEHVELAA